MSYSIFLPLVVPIFCFVEISRLQSACEQNELEIQAMVKEQKISELSIKQRDAEIERLQKLNR